MHDVLLYLNERRGEECMTGTNLATQPARQTWEAGDFPKMGVELATVGELLCDSIPVHAGDRVLDVGTASGNTAISAARRSVRG